MKQKYFAIYDTTRKEYLEYYDRDIIYSNFPDCYALTRDVADYIDLYGTEKQKSDYAAGLIVIVLVTVELPE